MASYLRRCVVMRDRVPGDFQTNEPDKYLYWRPDNTSLPSGGYRNIGFYQETQTKKVRLWVSWKWLQPYVQTQNPAADTNLYTNPQHSYSWSYSALGSPADYVASLDQEISVARQYGLHVILTLYEFPRWANGTADKPDNWDPYGQYTGEPPKPINRLTASGQVKSIEFYPPWDVGVSSPWGRIVEFLIARYRNQLYFLEIMNEPNNQWWPQKQQDGVTPNNLNCTVAQMMQTAQTIKNAYGGLPRLMAPAVNDLVGDDRGQTDHRSFIGPGPASIIQALDYFNFQAAADFAWSHHNYEDVTKDRGDGSLNNNPGFDGNGPGKTYAHGVRNRLKSWADWTGWPRAEPNDPYVMITEGGTRLSTLRSYYYDDTTPESTILAKQAALIERNWKRMKGDADPAYSAEDSPGIGMVANYTWYGDPGFDTGLIRPYDPNVAPNLPPNTPPQERPAYETWEEELLPAY